jgi:hypothetical protein
LLRLGREHHDFCSALAAASPRARLAEDCGDQHLAERLRLMAADLDSEANEVKELPAEQLRHVKPPLAA